MNPTILQTCMWMALGRAKMRVHHQPSVRYWEAISRAQFRP